MAQDRVRNDTLCQILRPLAAFHFPLNHTAVQRKLRSGFLANDRRKCLFNLKFSTNFMRMVPDVIFKNEIAAHSVELLDWAY